MGETLGGEMIYIVDNFWHEPVVSDRKFDSLADAIKFVSQFPEGERWTLYARHVEDQGFDSE
jgi:hypothetical protein